MTMNQKRITNQILTQELSLNSTLNYLFNISNMKKLFSYLLISSMVVLSSCTNYDDQFDDLNSQINSLKGQIEGFSSLSSGLTALQGTVASLQSAVANIPVTPATDISGLESSLETLAASVAELQAALANAATADEVAALATALAAQQADLTELLAQNNIYSSNITISSQADLDFATALGDKVVIVDGNVTITQNKEMDADQLATLMGKMTSVTGDVTYTATISTTTPGVFTNLNGSKKITIAQTGDISLPAYVQATGALSITGDDLTTSVDLSKLKAATSLAFAGLDNVTSFNMSSMVAYDGNINIDIDNTGSVDLSSFTNDTNADGTADTTPDTLTINAASLTAPVYAAGVITADRLTSVDLPKWKYAHGSSFDRASTVVLPSVDPGKATSSFTIAIDAVFPAATSVHFIAAPNTHTGVKASEHVNVTSTSTKLETLILGGTYTTINISGADVTSITFDGTAHSVTVNGTDVETLDLPYTTAAEGSFVVTGNTKLTSVSADKIDALKTFTLTGNSDLTDISFAALKTVSAKGGVINISGNDLAIESVSDKQTSPVVAKKVISADFNELKAFLTAGIAGITATNGGEVKVSADLADVVKAFDAAGDERDPASGDEVIANYDYLAVADNSVGAVSKVEEMYITAVGAESSFKVAEVQANGQLGSYETVSLLSGTGLEDYYDVKNWADAQATKDALADAGLEIVSYGKGQRTATFEFADATLTNISAVVTFQDGGVETVSVTTGSASTTTEIAEAIALALENGDGVVSKYYTVTNAGGKEMTFTSNAKGSHRQAFALAMTAQMLSGTVGATSISFASASTIVDNNIESTSGAYVQFKSTNTGAAGARSISLVGTGTTAQLLAASGVNTTHAGDDETFTAAVTGVANTADNSAAVAAVSVNNVQYLAGS